MRVSLRLVLALSEEARSHCSPKRRGDAALKRQSHSLGEMLGQLWLEGQSTTSPGALDSACPTGVQCRPMKVRAYSNPRRPALRHAVVVPPLREVPALCTARVRRAGLRWGAD